MQIVYKKLSEIKPYKRNPRNNEPAIDAVAKSIKEFGFKVPIVIDKDGEIVAGHTRYKASQKLGLKEVPCIVADDLNEDQIKAFRLADNKTNELATWNEELLALELADIKLDMTGFGFEPVMVEESEPVEDNYEVVLPDQTKTRTNYGELWQLGEHRLMVGDATNPKDIEKLMNGEKADLIMTDPPYNVNVTGSDNKKILNDNMGDEEFEEFLYGAFQNLNEHLKDGGAFYVWHASNSQREFENALNRVGLRVRQQIIWNKNSLVLGRSDYQWKHELCFYGWKEGNHYFIDDRTQTTVQELEQTELTKLKKEDLIKLLEEILSYETTVINEAKPQRNPDHPTMKPIRLIGRLVKNSSRPKEKVLDLFGGSGSTLIACEELGRVCYINELDPRYADVILDRWEQMTGNVAKKIK